MYMYKMFTHLDVEFQMLIKPIMVEELIKERLNMQNNNSLDMVDERGWEEVYIFSILFIPRKCVVKVKMLSNYVHPNYIIHLVWQSIPWGHVWIHEIKLAQACHKLMSTFATYFLIFLCLTNWNIVILKIFQVQFLTWASLCARWLH